MARAVKAAPGTLLIDAAKQVGIEIPAFCYYDGLHRCRPPAACAWWKWKRRPKLQVALHHCRLPKAWWCNTDSRRRSTSPQGTLEFLLTNHPLDCPVCDKGGECELQDMVFRYGAGREPLHGKQAARGRAAMVARGVLRWPRCILCYPLRARVR
jgi:NADH-quinone oxidoreductase subunit G